MDFLTLISKFNENLKPNDRLGQRQLEAAKAMYTESLNAGIDPRLTIAMGWQESKLGGKGKSAVFIGDQNRGEDHAIGYLQVLKTTAQSMGLGSEWQTAKDKFGKTGQGDPDLSAKLGVAYIKRLVDKHGATNIADISAAYNGGPSKIGTNYGKARKYAEAVSQHMGLFGDGQKVSWKQTGLAASGQFAALAPASASDISQPPGGIQRPPAGLPSMPAAAQAPVAPDPAQQPVQQAQSFGFDTPFPMPEVKQAAFNPFAQLNAGVNMPMSFDELLGSSGLAPLAYAEKDPREELRGMVSNLYDTLDS
jgi:Transglycosylase SLT domain